VWLPAIRGDIDQYGRKKGNNEIRLGKALKDAGGDITSKFCKEFVMKDDGTLTLKNIRIVSLNLLLPALKKLIHGGIIKHA